MAPAASSQQARLAAIDRYLLPTGRPAANRPTVIAAVDRRDIQTDGRRTLDRFIPAPHTMRATSEIQVLAYIGKYVQADTEVMTGCV